MSKGVGTTKVLAVSMKTDGHCGYCGRKLPLEGEDVHVDHMTPRGQGGTNQVSNLVLACKRCNSVKGGKDVEEFREYIFGSAANTIENALVPRMLYLRSTVDGDALDRVVVRLAEAAEEMTQMAPRFFFETLED